MRRNLYFIRLKVLEIAFLFVAVVSVISCCSDAANTPKAGIGSKLVKTELVTGKGTSFHIHGFGGCYQWMSSNPKYLTVKVDSIDGNDPALCSSSAKVQVEWSSEQPISAIIIALETSTLENIFFEVIIDIIACLELEIYSSSSKKQLKGTVLSTGNQFSFRLVAVNSRKEQFTQLPAFECSFEPLIPMHYYLMKVDSDPVKDRNQIEQFEIQHFVIEGGQSLLFTPLTAGSVKISITLNESFKLAMNMSSPYFEALLIVRDELIFNPDLPTVVTSSVELPVHVIGGNRCVSLSNSLYTFSTSILQGEASALIDYNSGRVVFKQPGTIEFSARYYEGLWNSNETSIEPLAVSDPVHVVEPEYLKIRIVREFCFLYEDMELDDVQQIQTQEAAEPYLIEGRYYLIFVDIYDSHHRLVQQFGKDYRLSLRDFGDLFETKAQVNSWSVFTKAVGEGSLCAVLERVNHNPDGNIDEWSVVVTSLLNVKSAAPVKIRPGSYLAIPDLPALPPVELLVAGGIGDESEKRYIMYTTPNCFVRFRVLYMDEKNIVHGSTKVTQMKWSENIKQYTNPANCAALIEDYYDRTNRDLVVFFPVSLRFIEFERGYKLESNLLLHFQARDHNLWRGWNVPVVLNDVENQSFTSMVLIHSNQLCSCKERDSVDSNPLEQKKQKNTQQESKERSPTVANVPSTTVLGSFIRFLFQLGIWAAWLSMCGGTIVGLLLGGWKLGGIVGNYIKKNIIEVVVVTIEKKYCAFEGRYKKRTETVDTSRKKYICIALIIGGIMGIAAIADFVSNFISQYPQGYFGHFDSYVWNLLVLAIASLALFFITLANTSMDHDSPIVFIIIILFLFSYGIYSGVQTSNERKMKL